MAQRESKLSRKIMDALRGEGAWCMKVWGNEHTLVGAPDIIGVYQGIFFAVETKMPESRSNVSPAQARQHSKIAEAGGAVRVCCSVGEAKRFMLSLSLPSKDDSHDQ